MKPVVWSLLLALSGLAGTASLAQDGREERPTPRPQLPGETPPPKPERTDFPRLGVAVAEVPVSRAEVLGLQPNIGLDVQFVIPGSPADTAGIEIGDVLTRLEDQWLILPRQLEVLIQNREVGDVVSLTYLRKGESTQTETTLDAAPPVSPMTVTAGQAKFRVTNRTIKVTHEGHTFLLTSHNGSAFLKVKKGDGEAVVDQAVRSANDIPEEFRTVIGRIAGWKDGQWQFRIPLPPANPDGPAPVAPPRLAPEPAK